MVSYLRLSLDFALHDIVWELVQPSWTYYGLRELPIRHFDNRAQLLQFPNLKSSLHIEESVILRDWTYQLEILDWDARVCK